MIEIVDERGPLSNDKLKKPKELKGIKPVFSIKWGGTTACQVIVKGDDVWIKHNDWCSKSFYNAKVGYKKIFIYSDGFMAPTIKGSAWIVIRGLIQIRAVDAIRLIQQEADRSINQHSRFCRDDVRMFEDIILRLSHDGIMFNSKW